MRAGDSSARVVYYSKALQIAVGMRRAGEPEHDDGKIGGYGLSFDVGLQNLPQERPRIPYNGGEAGVYVPSDADHGPNRGKDCQRNYRKISPTGQASEPQLSRARLEQDQEEFSFREHDIVRATHFHDEFGDRTQLRNKQSQHSRAGRSPDKRSPTVLRICFSTSSGDAK